MRFLKYILEFMYSFLLSFFMYWTKNSDYWNRTKVKDKKKPKKKKKRFTVIGQRTQKDPKNFLIIGIGQS